MSEAVRKRFPEDVKVEIHKVLKNNALTLDGMVILAPGQVLSPNFYLQVYYEEYKNGIDIASLAQKMEETYYEILHSENRLRFDMSYENCAQKIVFRLVSYEKNFELLQTVPFIRFLDMAVIFYILLRQDDEGIGSVRITNQLLANWNLETEALFALAKENTKRIFPKKIYSMSSVMMPDMDSGKLPEIRSTTAPVTADDEKRTQEPYVLTNSNGINGAAVILYSNVLKEVGAFLGGDYYLLPSSIHELLAIPASASMSESEMSEMVKEVNHLYVAREEVLSDSVYRYECDTETIRIC